MLLRILKSKKTIAFFTVIIVSWNAILMAGCITDSSDKNNTPDTDIVIGMTSNISGFYPWMATQDLATQAVNVNLFDCLVELDHFTYKFIPALAENWNNPNNVTWRFFLRKGVKFHTGDLFAADDVKFTFDYMRNDSYYSKNLGDISDIIIRDNYTIDIITKKPSPTFLYNLVTLFILSEEYINAVEDTNEPWPIGTGPYKLVEYTPGESIIAERFDEYWGGQPEVHTVLFKKMNTIEEIKQALLSGEIDIGSLAIGQVGEIQNTTGFLVRSVQTPSLTYLSFDFRVNDSYGYKDTINPVSDVRVRKAMYHAIDIETIIEKYLKGAATPASQFVTSYTFGYNPAISRLPYDITLAKELMREAGYDAGFTIVLDTINSAKSINISTEIARQLAEINITIIVNSLPEDEYYVKLYFKNTSLYITGIMPLEAEGLIKLLLQTSNMEKSDGIWNYGNYSNPEVDRLWEILSSTMDTWKRREYFYEIFSLAASDVAWIPLYSSKIFYGMKQEINWRPSPSLYFWIKDISFTK